MKKTQSGISIFLVIITVLGIFLMCNPTRANAESIVGNISTGDMTIPELPFADDHVLVVLTNEASLEFSNYSISDFPEINCNNVTNLTSETGNLVKAKVNGATTHATDSGHLPLMDVEAESYKQILCIELSEAGTENIAQAIKLLSQRDDVLYAEPD